MGSSSNWTPRQNQVFENALATYEDKPEWWQNVAGAVGKSVDEVKRHFRNLLEDIKGIETGKVPIPNYNSFPNNNNNGYK